MARIPRPLIASLMYFPMILAYILLATNAGSDPHVVRTFAWDLVAVTCSAILIGGAVLGCFGAADRISAIEGESSWNVPLLPKETPPFKHAA